jgi:hypothetical protein
MYLILIDMFILKKKCWIEVGVTYGCPKKSETVNQHFWILCYLRMSCFKTVLGIVSNLDLYILYIAVITCNVKMPGL